MDDAFQNEQGDNIALNASETATLLSRMSIVFGRPVSELRQVFLHSTDADFDHLWKSMHSQLIHESKNTSDVNFSKPNYLYDLKSNEGSSVTDSSHSETVSGRGYSRPVIPPPAPAGDGLSEEYLLQLTEALIYSLSFRDSACVQDIVMQCPQVVTRLAAEDMSAVLHSDLSYSSLHCLLQEGVDANTFDKFGGTLLHRYVSDQNLDYTKLLLKYNADCNIEDKRNQRTPLQMTALQGDFEALYSLLTTSKVPVKVDKPDFDGNSLLHLVLLSEFPDVQYKSISMLLLDRGLSPTAKNLRGETPLHYFCVNQTLCGTGYIEPLFELLLEEGLKDGSVNLMDDDRCTPLIIACAHREWELCKILIRRGADINIPCSMRSALLVRGCDASRSEMIDFESDCTTADLMPRSVRHKIFPYICSTQSLVDPESRDRCMNCAALFPADVHSFTTLFSAETKTNCLNCGRVVCQECVVQSDLPVEKLPEYLREACGSADKVRVCLVCHPILSRDLVLEKFW